MKLSKTWSYRFFFLRFNRNKSIQCASKKVQSSLSYIITFLSLSKKLEKGIFPDDLFNFHLMQTQSSYMRFNSLSLSLISLPSMEKKILYFPFRIEVGKTDWAILSPIDRHARNATLYIHKLLPLCKITSSL